MRKIILIVFLLLAPLVSQADLKILSCEPAWAVLAKEIGADRVKADSATNALQDPHQIQARPSLIAKFRRADLLICSGAQLEIGWLPMLLRKGNNPAVQPGSTGYIEASAYVSRLEVPASVDRSLGDVHPGGNPHVQTDPHNILRVAEVLAKRMAQLDPAGAEAYKKGMDDFRQRWLAAIKTWQLRTAPLRGKKVITHHKNWVYLEHWLGLTEVANLEPVPGVPPTAGHLSKLLEQFGKGGADLIIRSPYQSDKASNWLAQRTGIPAVMLPSTVGGSDAAKDLFSLFDDTLNRLLTALGQ